MSHNPSEFWLIVMNNGVEVGQIPLDPNYGEYPNRPTTARAIIVQSEHKTLIAAHQGMAPGEKRQLSDNLVIRRRMAV